MTGAVPREQQTIDEGQIFRQVLLAPCTVPAEDTFKLCPPLWLQEAGGVAVDTCAQGVDEAVPCLEAAP